MFRWLKERKKQKSSARKKNDEDYGFHSSNGSDSSDYGFTGRFHGQFHPGFKDVKQLDDAAYHIYEEILDLPSALDSPNTNGDRAQTSQSLAHQITEGPYMVVPIIVNDYGEIRGEKCDACGESSPCARLCNCENARILNEANYSPPWDSSDESSVLSRLPKTRECEEFQNLQNFIVKDRHFEATDAYLSSDKSDSSHSSRSSYSSRSFRSSRSNSEMDYNDTCCEYDMSTSGESDVSEGGTYKLCLERVQHNLLLKHQVRNIIKTLSKKDDTICEESSTITTDRSDAESLSSRPSSVPNVNDLFDPEVFIEKSESDDSSGYYECSDDVPQSRSSESNENIKPRRHHTKHKSHLKKLRNHSDRLNSCGAIQEDTEMYLLPTTKRDSEYNTSKLQRKPLLPPKSAAIYHDPSRSKNGSNNRLLSDLIRMNYEKQHMFRV